MVEIHKTAWPIETPNKKNPHQPGTTPKKRDPHLQTTDMTYRYYLQQTRLREFARGATRGVSSERQAPSRFWWRLFLGVPREKPRQMAAWATNPEWQHLIWWIWFRYEVRDLYSSLIASASELDALLRKWKYADQYSIWDCLYDCRGGSVGNRLPFLRGVEISARPRRAPPSQRRVLRRFFHFFPWTLWEHPHGEYKINTIIAWELYK